MRLTWTAHAIDRWVTRVRSDPRTGTTAWHASQFLGRIVWGRRLLPLYGYRWHDWVLVVRYVPGRRGQPAQWVCLTVWPLPAWERRWRQQQRDGRVRAPRIRRRKERV